MLKYGKKYRKALDGLDLQQRYDVVDAVSMAVARTFTNFDETVDVALCLGVDPKHSDQMVRGAVTPPHGLGKVVRVAAFCKGDKEAVALAAGADITGGEDLVDKVKGGFLEFDKAVATPDMMAKVGQIGRILGPRGLMPNAKMGTVTFDIGMAIRELKAGRIEFKVDKAGVLHVPLGKVSFGLEKICDNLKSFLDTVQRLKPSAAKGAYMQAMSVATTMGPGIRVDILSVRKFLEGNV
ncbi:50S ribosomal subunit protein L1 [Desulfovibrionales bacterium]